MSGLLKIVIIPESVCAERIEVDIRDGRIVDVRFGGGCDGNNNAFRRLLPGMEVERVATLLAGVDCDGSGTSCADQLARGLRDAIPDLNKE